MSRPETAVTRVTAYLQAVEAEAFERSHVDFVPLGKGVVVRLTAEDLRALLDILAESCDDHASCEHCGAVGCETCAVGPVLTDCFPPHCEDSECWCGPCRDDVAREFRAEQRADVDRFGA